MYIVHNFKKAKVFGIDINELAINNAIKRSKTLQHERKRISFICGNIFDLPFKDNYFDFVIGQDPDGLGHEKRKYIFQEINRVLKKNGRLIFHHWILGLGAPSTLKNRFDRISSRNGFSSLKNLNAEMYLRDLLLCRFKSFCYTDKSEDYYRQMKKMQKKLERI